MRFCSLHWVKFAQVKTWAQVIDKSLDAQVGIFGKRQSTKWNFGQDLSKKVIQVWDVGQGTRYQLKLCKG